MSQNNRGFAGFTCRYTPLPLMYAAGFVPYRVLPISEAPDTAGTILHDNMCPHVKVVLDRALAGDLPPLEGMVFVNSCDAMRRLADAWRRARPDDSTLLLDLPLGDEPGGVQFFAAELQRLRDELDQWSGAPVGDAAIEEAWQLYDRLAAALGRLNGSRSRHQELINRAVTSPPEALLTELEELAVDDSAAGETNGVPLLLFGNVLPDPAAFELFAACGARLAHNDLCTGTRQLPRYTAGDEPVLARLAQQMLSTQPCSRTLDPGSPGQLATLVLEQARACGARGVIAHTLKFCDPYLVRLPAVRETLRNAGIPLLVLEGDCTMRSLGQHRTRIEAFVEMLEGGA